MIRPRAVFELSIVMLDAPAEPCPVHQVIQRGGSERFDNQYSVGASASAGHSASSQRRAGCRRTSPGRPGSRP